MEILFVSTSYPSDSEDWRGRFIANLVEAINCHDDVTIHIWAPPGDLPQNVIRTCLPNDANWLRGLMAQGGIAQLLRAKGLRAVGTILRLLLSLRRVFRQSSKTDLAHINWLQNALPLWGTNTPAVIGVLGSDYKLLNLKGMPGLLRTVLKQRKCIIAPNAGWMAPRLNQLFGDLAEIRPIPFGVDQRWFKIIRQLVENHPSRWITVSRITRKKIGPLLEWGKDIFKNQYELHLIGPMQENIKLPEWVRYHGPASPDELCETWFQKATGLITLSQHDEGRPQVVLEAMAAGLPVVASDIPAHLDIIRHQNTGWIATSAIEFKEAITSLSDAETNHTIGNEARCWVEENIGTWHDCANRYIHAYHDLLEVNK